MKRLRFNEAYNLEVEEKDAVMTQESTSDGSFKGYVIANLAAIHAGVTKNDTVYGADRLRGDEEKKTGIYSWTYPYNKPVLTHHDLNQDPIGRVLDASYMKATSRPFIKLKVKVSEKDAAEKVLDGRYDTVSIGAETDSAVCTICGTDIVEEGYCGHMKGNVYDGETCRWVLGDLWFNEVSYVNRPADVDAGTLSSEIVEESASDDAQVMEKLGDGTAVPIVVPDEDKPLPTETTQESVEAKTTDRQEGELELPGTDNKSQEDVKETTNVEEQEIVVTEEEVKKLQEELDVSKKTIAEKDEAIDTLEAEKKALEKEKEKLLDDLNKKSNQLHESLAERIVDMRISLGKPVAESREDEVKKYAERSADSLKDTMADLMLEGKEQGPKLRDQVEEVTNPGAAVDNGTEPNTHTEGVEQEEKKTTIEPGEIREKTLEVFKSLLNGNKN